jgi:hypothetical protein
MKTYFLDSRLSRRRDLKKVLTKIGPRIFVFLIVSPVLLGAVAISMNMKLQEREKAHHHSGAKAE